MGRKPQTRQARALAIGRKIAEIETEIRPLLAKLSQLKKEHALLFGGPYEADDTIDDEEDADTEVVRAVKIKRKAPAKKERRQREGTLSTRVLECLATLDERGASVEEMAEALGQPNRQSLRGTLVELCQHEKIVRVERGRYASRVTTIRPTLVAQR